MPGFFLHLNATVQCAHQGMATPTTPNPKVLVSGMPITTMPKQYVIAGCPFTNGTTPQPCLTAQWTSAAMKVFAGGEPVLLMDSQAITTPNGVPLLVTSTQQKVIGA
ncbi:MAG: hypothetical protein U0996_25520 [Planctomycetaceae bacterium]